MYRRITETASDRPVGVDSGAGWAHSRITETAHRQGVTVKLAKNQTEQTTLAAMLRAADHHHPVTITYTKADGTETIRTIEIAECRTTRQGHVILRAADRTSGEMRTFRLDRIQAYTVHRTAYTVALPADETPAPVMVPATPAALVAYELGRDDRTTTRARLAHAA